MELRVNKQVCESEELTEINLLLHELQLVNRQLNQEKEQSKVLKHEHRVELEALVAERTEELQAENFNLRIADG